MRVRWSLLFLLGGSFLVRPMSLPAQDTDGTDVTADSTESVPSARSSVSVVELGIAAGTLVGASLLDRPIRDYLQDHRTESGDDFARVMKKFGEPVVFAPVPAGLIAVGVISGNHRITRAGGRITAGLFTAALVTNVLKPIGRVRPRFADDAYEFTPFEGESWPSGHATMAFALAAGLSDEVRSTPVTIALYSAAGLSAWSRMNDNRHWFTDVAAGALIGITSAKVMNGRWSFLGITGPRFLQEPGHRAAKESRARLLLTPGSAGLSIDF